MRSTLRRPAPGHHGPLDLGPRPGCAAPAPAQPVAIRRDEDQRSDRGSRTRMIALECVPHTGRLVVKRELPPGSRRPAMGDDRPRQRGPGLPGPEERDPCDPDVDAVGVHPVVPGAGRAELHPQRVAARAGREVVVVDLLPGGRSDADVVARDRVAPDVTGPAQVGPEGARRHAAATGSQGVVARGLRAGRGRDAHVVLGRRLAPHVAVQARQRAVVAGGEGGDGRAGERPRRGHRRDAANPSSPVRVHDRQGAPRRAPA